MKRNLPIFIAALVMTALAVVLILKNKKGTLDEALKDFAVKDTAAVTKIFLADKAGHQITLDRMPSGKWKVNQKYFARYDAVDMLLRTVHDMEVKTPVAKSMRNTILKLIASTGIKTEIYQGTTHLKTFYIGNATSDQQGTYMILENSSDPFVMHIPGFRGYLTPRFFTGENDWRDPLLYGYNPNEIASVSIEYPKTPERSFIVRVSGKNNYEVTSTASGQKLSATDPLKVNEFLAAFNLMNFESFAKEYDLKKKDSVIATVPEHIITVTDLQGKKNIVKTFLRPNKAQVDEIGEPLTDKNGNPIEVDLDRLYALINEGRDFVTVQYFSLNRILKTASWFSKDSPVQK